MKGVVWIFCCCLALSTARVSGAVHDSLTTPIIYDSTEVNVRQFDQNALDVLRTNPDFSYDEKGLDLSWWKRFMQWLRYKWQELFMQDGALSLWEGVLITLGVAVLCYLILKLLGMDAVNLFSRKAIKPQLDFMEQPENIHGIDFAQALQQAIDSGNFRLAVRLLYLDCLKKLNDVRLIAWEPNKTNTTYANELTEPTVRDEFRRLTRQFEYIWYGDFGINKQHFAQLREAFRQFDDRLR